MIFLSRARSILAYSFENVIYRLPLQKKKMQAVCLLEIFALSKFRTSPCDKTELTKSGAVSSSSLHQLEIEF